jgi:hypothetical protein
MCCCHRVCVTGCLRITWRTSVSDLVDQQELSAITAFYEDEERGPPPYHPVMMTKVNDKQQLPPITDTRTRS